MTKCEPIVNVRMCIVSIENLPVTYLPDKIRLVKYEKFNFDCFQQAISCPDTWCCISMQITMSKNTVRTWHLRMIDQSLSSVTELVKFAPQKPKSLQTVLISFCLSVRGSYIICSWVGVMYVCMYIQHCQCYLPFFALPSKAWSEVGYCTLWVWECVFWPKCDHPHVQHLNCHYEMFVCLAIGRELCIHTHAQTQCLFSYWAIVSLLSMLVEVA